MLGRIRRADLVKDLAIVFERDESVREPARNEQLVPLLRGENETGPAAKARRVAANVERDIEDRAAGHADEFVLGRWRDLEVKPANDAAASRMRIIVLNEAHIDPRIREPSVAPDLGKEAAFVEPSVRSKLDQPFDFERAQLNHYRTPARGGADRRHNRYSRADQHAAADRPCSGSRAQARFPQGT